jgi:hypothetical protein
MLNKTATISMVALNFKISYLNMRLGNSQMNLGKTADKPKRDRKTKQPIFETSYLIYYFV